MRKLFLFLVETVSYKPLQKVRTAWKRTPKLKLGPVDPGDIPGTNFFSCFAYKFLKFLLNYYLLKYVFVLLLYSVDSTM